MYILDTRVLILIVWLQGYNNLLRDIFEDAGLLKSQRVKVGAEVPAGPKTHASLQECSEVRTPGGGSSSLDQLVVKCQIFQTSNFLICRTFRNRVKKWKDYARCSPTTTFPLNPLAVSPFHLKTY